MRLSGTMVNPFASPKIISRNLTGSHVSNLRGAPGSQNRDINLTFSGPRLQRGYRCYVTITKPRCARQLKLICCLDSDYEYIPIIAHTAVATQWAMR